MASVKSQGIIGDKYIQLSLGGDEEIFKPGERIVDTESSVDIESLISKFAFGSVE
jgi:phospholipid/cholesterol/gamma-HCH transport system substrate-binding protein